MCLPIEAHPGENLCSPPYETTTLSRVHLLCKLLKTFFIWRRRIFFWQGRKVSSSHSPGRTKLTRPNSRRLVAGLGKAVPILNPAPERAGHHGHHAIERHHQCSPCVCPTKERGSSRTISVIMQLGTACHIDTVKAGADKVSRLPARISPCRTTASEACCASSKTASSKLRAAFYSSNPRMKHLAFRQQCAKTQ